jgi:hypothetical protein
MGWVVVVVMTAQAEPLTTTIASPRLGISKRMPNEEGTS